MSRIGRREMLKVMAASAATAAAAGTGIGKALAGAPSASSPTNPFQQPTAPRTASGLRTPLAAGNRSLNFMGQEFKPLDSTYTYTGAQTGGIQAVSGPTNSYYRASVNLPNAAVVTQVLFDVVVNDANPATVYFNGFNPETAGFNPVLPKPISTTSASIQTVDMGIPPTTIDAVNLAYALYWFPGTNGPTHQLIGARVAWLMEPGLTLFPNPRRVLSGDLTPFTAGTTYGPIDATKKTDTTASGVPAGAQAAFCAVQSYTPGVLTLFPDLTSDTGIANYSATGTAGSGLNVLYMMVPLSPAGKFKIHSYLTGRVYVDAWGFLV
jgi:hypothetical protein